jgi:hypothetical protein
VEKVVAFVVVGSVCVHVEDFIKFMLVGSVGVVVAGLGILEVVMTLPMLVDKRAGTSRSVGSLDGQGMSGSLIPRRHKVARAEGLVARHKSAMMGNLILDCTSNECID